MKVRKWRWPRLRSRPPSPFLVTLRDANLLGQPGVREWMYKIERMLRERKDEIAEQVRREMADAIAWGRSGGMLTGPCSLAADWDKP